MGNLLTQTPIFFPRGVTDSAGHAAYLMNFENGIDAINLSNGALLWQTNAVRKPLIVLQNRLVVELPARGRPSTLQIGLLDLTQNGQLLLTSEPIDFPDWVQVQEARESEFSYSVAATNQELVFSWQAHTHYKGGAPPSQRRLEQAKKDAFGAARVNLQSGEVTMLVSEPTLSERQPPWRQTITSQPYRQKSTIQTTPWTVNHLLAALVPTDTKTPQALTLKLWDVQSGAVVKVTELPHTATEPPIVTLNGRYLLFLPKQNEKIPDENKIWQVYSVETGQLLSTLPYINDLHSASVSSGNIFLLRAMQQNFMIVYVLIARVLQSTEILWERTLYNQRTSPPPKLRG